MVALPKPTKLEIAPGYLLLLLGPIVVFVGTEYFLQIYADVDIVVPNIELRDDAAVSELVGRYKFYAALFFYGSVGVSIAGIFLIDLVSRHTMQSIATTAIGVIVIFAIVIVFTILEPEGAGVAQTWNLLGLNVFEATLGAGHISGCAEGPPRTGCVPPTAFDAMRELLARINLFGALGASGGILGTILTLSRPVVPHDLATSHGRAEAARALKGAREACQRYLYCAGLMLTSGMTVLIAWMNWPAAALADTDARTLFVDLVGSLSLFVGVSYSLVILSFYMPVTLILATRINRLRHLMTKDGPRIEAAPEVAEEPESEPPPQIDQFEALKAVIAIVSPILASAIGTFGNTILFD